MKLKVTVNGTPYTVEVDVEPEEQPGLGSLLTTGVRHPGPTPTAPTSASVKGASKNAVVAPLAGSVAQVLVKAGDKIDADQVLVVLEAMKMETEITAPQAGMVSVVHVEPGQAVQGGQALVELE
ncbi:biotin/lipoyl-containing protein [Granulicoccus sp. GXG6511]|uniref:biotin/lipoyl-containing protein n=1 Tax=Granulicoccus sp. GXG6511 TaxID=3381351 RepID=UPI003D7E7022